MKNAWQKWMRISKKVVGVQATVVFGIIFLLIITPLSLFLKVVNRNVFYGSGYMKKENSYWSKMPKRKYELDSARKQ
jgi:hypothetical protein